MKAFEKIELLTIRQIEECLIDVADTVMHCGDNYLPVDLVMKMVRGNFHAQMEKALRTSLHELEERRASDIPPLPIPPWMVGADEKQHTKYQTQARKSL